MPATAYRARIVAPAPAPADARPDAGHEMAPIVKETPISLARAKAASIILEAEEQAEAIRATALAEADAIKDAARQEAEEQVATEVLEGRHKLDGELLAIEPRLSSIVFNSVRKIIGSMAEEDVCRGVISHALSSLREDTTAIILVNPRDLAAMSSAVEKLPDHKRSAIRAVESDHALSPGECRLKTPDIVLDIGVETQMRALARRLALPHDISQTPNDA